MDEASQREQLSWLTGLFAAKGGITLSRGTNFTGSVALRCRDRRTVERVLWILRELNFEQARRRNGGGSSNLLYSATAGTQLLKLLDWTTFPERLMHRAEVYIRMFPIGQEGEHRTEERQQVYLDWLKLMIDERKQKTTTEAEEEKEI